MVNVAAEGTAGVTAVVGAAAPTGLRGTIAEVLEGVANVRVWGYLGWIETKRRYRRTILGPFWVTLTHAIFIGATGFLYAKLWHQPVHHYLPYLSSGIICWSLIASVFNESGTVYLSSAGLLTQMKFNLPALAMALIWRNLIVFIHTIVVFIVIAIVLNVPVNENTLLVIPGLFLVCLNLMWLVLLFGMVGVRYRDVQQVFNNITQIAMFVTPVFWTLSSRGKALHLVANLNPFYHLLVVIRDPIMGQSVHWLPWAVNIAMAIVGWTLALYAMTKYRHRVIFWL